MKTIGELRQALSAAHDELERKAKYSRQYLAETDANTEYLGHVIEDLRNQLKALKKRQIALSEKLKVAEVALETITENWNGSASEAARKALDEIRK